MPILTQPEPSPQSQVLTCSFVENSTWARLGIAWSVRASPRAPRLKALVLAATLALACAWSPTAGATGKSLTVSLHPLYLLMRTVEVTHESRLGQSSRSVYVAMGVGLPEDADVQTKMALGYRFYPVGSYYSGLTISVDIGGGYAPAAGADSLLVLGRSFIGWKQVFSGLVLDGGMGLGIGALPAEGVILPIPTLKTNVGIAF